MAYEIMLPLVHDTKSEEKSGSCSATTVCTGESVSSSRWWMFLPWSIMMVLGACGSWSSTTEPSKLNVSHIR